MVTFRFHLVESGLGVMPPSFCQGEMDYRNISYVPALYKVFDEILVNAADNLQRDPKMKAN